jgi:hypothetical protein
MQRVGRSHSKWCGGGGVPRLAKGSSPWTYPKQGVGKRSGRFEPNMLEPLLKYVSSKSIVLY